MAENNFINAGKIFAVFFLIIGLLSLIFWFFDSEPPAHILPVSLLLIGISLMKLGTGKFEFF